MPETALSWPLQSAEWLLDQPAFFWTFWLVQVLPPWFKIPFLCVPLLWPPLRLLLAPRLWPARTAATGRACVWLYLAPVLIAALGTAVIATWWRSPLFFIPLLTIAWLPMLGAVACDPLLRRQKKSTEPSSAPH